MKYLFTIVVVILSIRCFGQMDTLIVKDLKVGWLSFDEQGNTIPYQEDKSEIIFFEPPSDVEPNTYLLINCLTDFDIWINDQLIHHGFSGKLQLPIDSLNSAYMTPPSLTFFAKSWKSPELQTSLYKLTPTQDRNPYSKVGRQGFLSADVYLICLTMLIGLLGIYRRFFPSSFSKAFQNPLGFKLRGLSAEDTYLGFVSFDNILSITIFGLMSALLVSYLGYQPIPSVANPNWGPSLGAVLMLASLFMLYVVVKYLLGHLVASIFDYKGVANIQTQDYTHFCILAISLCLALSAFDFTLYNFTSAGLKTTVVVTLIISMIFFQFWLLMKLDKFYSHRKLMIITYLCTTEFLPGFLIVYWLVKS
ncbi:MAG: DUF4271 domain-containing protein [Marinoscillum sp.]